jgi:NADH dehydrogenase
MNGRIGLTGAFGYVGSATARRLRDAGHEIHTLTNRTNLHVDGITVAPLRFELDYLVAQMRGLDTFINNYWIRIPYAGQTFRDAIANNAMLVEAARRAGVRRYVHVSVSNPDRGRNLAYYEGKLQCEQAVQASGLSYGIVRPTLVVGPQVVLTNNIAWFLRRFLVFPSRRWAPPRPACDVGRHRSHHHRGRIVSRQRDAGRGRPDT